MTQLYSQQPNSHLINPSPLKTLPPSPPINHTISIQCLEPPLKGLHLTNLIVLLNVLLPEIGPVLFIVGLFISHGHSLGAKDLGRESVVLFDLAQKVHRFGKEMEGVHDHDLGPSRLQVSHPMEQVGDDDVAGDECVGEDGVAVVLHGDFEGEHGLFFEVFEAHFFRFGDEGFLIEHFVGGEGGE